MVTTNGVTSVDRTVRTVIHTMVLANRYDINWPKHCLEALDIIARQLRPLVKTFGRPLQHLLPLKAELAAVGFVVKEKWGFLAEKPAYVVCYSVLGWVLVDQSSGDVFINCSELLAEIIGDKIGGMQLFLDVCAYAVEELFRERRKRLHELEQVCLLRPMYESFDRSKWPDTLRFIEDR